jgi:hypothetical protein
MLYYIEVHLLGHYTHWTGVVWLGVGTSGRQAVMSMVVEFGFYKMLGITRSAGDLLSYQGG